jgi:hypothetical protein
MILALLAWLALALTANRAPKALHDLKAARAAAPKTREQLDDDCFGKETNCLLKEDR